MNILHKQISPLAATGKETETWGRYRLMRHLELIGPDKHLPEKEIKPIVNRDRQAERKKAAEAKVYTVSPDGDEIRPVPGHKGYYATEGGEVWSGKSGGLLYVRPNGNGCISVSGLYGRMSIRTKKMAESAWK